MVVLEKNKAFAFVDVETTGASPVYDRVIEIAIIRVENGEIVQKLHTVVDPEKHIPDTIFALTGITEREIKQAPTFNDIHREVDAILQDCIFVAHNARFDYGFLKNELKRAGIQYTAKCLCTVKLSRALFKRERRHDLSSIIERYDFKCENRHRALSDAEVLIDFINFCEKMHGQENVIKAITKSLKDSAVPAALPTGLVHTLPETSGVYIFYGEDGEKLYIGKSVNIKNRVLSHFAGDHSSGKEMRLAQEVRDIETISTSGELGALLLESHLIKKEQPLYNTLSRRSRKMIVLKEAVDQDGYKTAYLESCTENDLEADSSILGIFKSLMQAKKVLNAYAAEHSLCPKLLSLEKSVKNAGERKGCFYSQLGKCKGACKGTEDSIIYNTRFDVAFAERRLRQWPFSGPIMINEKNETDPSTGTAFIVDNWRLQGSFTYDDSGQKAFLQGYAFDYDSYKILSRYILFPKKASIKAITQQEAAGYLENA